MLNTDTRTATILVINALESESGMGDFWENLATTGALEFEREAVAWLEYTRELRAAVLGDADWAKVHASFLDLAAIG